MNKKLLITIFSCSLTLTSCSDWLDKLPQDKMSPETFFSNETELQAFSNSFYTSLPSSSLYRDDLDNITHGSAASMMRDGRVVPSSGGGWDWGNLRKFNTLLEYSVNCDDGGVRTRYDALARFFRAYFYFDKVRTFGDVPWYDKQVSSDDEAQLKKPRDSREYIMQRMIEDIDHAIANLSEDRSLYRITKWTALALKSRFCLFEGTFRKYHNVSYPEHSWEYYLEQSAAASLELMEKSGYSLYTEGGKDVCYRNLFSSHRAQGCEVILARNLNAEYKVYCDVGQYLTNKTFGRPGVTKKIINSYLMKDGTRFTDKAGYEKMSFTEECRNRDPRMAQSIRTPGYTRIGSTQQVAPDLATSITGYQPTKFLGTEAQDAGGASDNDLIIFRLGEIYLNYAEARAELGKLTQADLDKTINKLRDRVEMKHLNMNVANANIDPYLDNIATGYIGVTGINKGVILEIRRERSIELLQEGFRTHDILRWKEGQILTQRLLGIYFESINQEVDLDGDGKPDVCLYEGAKPGDKDGVTYLQVEKDIILSNRNYGYIEPHRDTKLSFNEERDYLSPIPSNERTLTGGALTQNPGWEDGLHFD